MPWISISDDLALNPKVFPLSMELKAVYVFSIAYCGRKLSDGEMSAHDLVVFLAEMDAALVAPESVARIRAALIEAGLWEDRPGGGIGIHDYLRYNPSREHVEHTRAARAQAGRAGGGARRQAPTPPPDDREDIPPEAYEWAQEEPLAPEDVARFEPEANCQATCQANCLATCSATDEAKSTPHIPYPISHNPKGFNGLKAPPAPCSRPSVVCKATAVAAGSAQTTAPTADRAPAVELVLTGDAPPEPTATPRRPGPKRRARSSDPSASAATWAAYAAAYERAYGTPPVRNARVNGQVAQLVARLGAEEAPKVAAWFVGHRNRWYVQAGHSIGALLHDAEKLHTEFARQVQLTETDIRGIDEQAASEGMWERAKREAARIIGERRAVANGAG